MSASWKTTTTTLKPIRMRENDTSVYNDGFHIALLALPEVGEEDSIWGIARRLANAFQFAPDRAVKSTIAWLDGGPIENRDLGPFNRADLEHELSDYMADASTEVFHKGRSKIEFEMLVHSDLPAAESIVNYEGFCKLLNYVKHATSPPPHGFRISSVSTVRDRNDNCVVYPSPDYILHQLSVIYNHWKRYRAIAPGFAAVVAMAALTNLHPFTDGNGRVARIVFNWTLNQNRAQPVYLPIYELSALSRCGYLVRLRQAQYHSKWVPLFQFLLLCSEKLFYDGSVNLVSPQPP